MTRIKLIETDSISLYPRPLGRGKELQIKRALALNNDA